MKKYLWMAVILFSTGAIAQTKVIKQTAVKGNNYGINYFLPKTELVVRAEISKVSANAGPYYKYAQKYLGIENPVTEDKVYYVLDKITLVSKGVPDKEQAYLVEFKSGTTAPFVYLTDDGLICTINADCTPEKTDVSTPANKPQDAKPAVHSVYTEEYLQAGSIGKMAEISAKQIYRLRESRMDLLTGDAENVPRDGEAMKLVLQQLEAQENTLVEQFKGTVTTEKQQFETSFIPSGNMEKEVLFRFSKYLGVVKPDDLSGNPVYLNLKNLDPKPVITNPKELEKIAKAKANPKGVVYNVPGKASVSIVYGITPMYSGEVLVAQFGDTGTLTNTIFEDKKAPVKVYFYLETGGIKQIIQ